MRWHTIVTAAALTITASEAHAACSCSCVNGQVQAICQNAMDLHPICSPQICPIVPPAVRPIQQPTVPPIGTSSCGKEQVLNPSTHLYEWQTVCH